MRRVLITGVMVLWVCLSSTFFVAAEDAGREPGDSLFKKHCEACHTNGGNILNPQKTLYRKDLEANGIRTPADIVKKMRNPGAFSTHPQEWSGMKMFDEKAISEEDALKIAEYILATFR